MENVDSISNTPKFPFPLDERIKIAGIRARKVTLSLYSLLFTVTQNNNINKNADAPSKSGGADYTG
jgi:hypothetical protein